LPQLKPKLSEQDRRKKGKAHLPHLLLLIALERIGPIGKRCHRSLCRLYEPQYQRKGKTESRRRGEEEGGGKASVAGFLGKGATPDTRKELAKVTLMKERGGGETASSFSGNGSRGESPRGTFTWRGKERRRRKNAFFFPRM